MKCPNCDSINGKTNKYCRTCGTRLEVLASREAETADSGEPRVDEVVLGEELFQVHELVESGDLDAALEQGEAIAADNPGSASAHAIAALVYERKADMEIAEGNVERGREFLKLAIERYETIIDLNPDSAADRGKLASLRLKYSGRTLDAAKPRPRIAIVDAVNKLPKPAIASAAAFVVLVVLVVAITGPSRGRPTRSARSSTANPPRTPVVTVKRAAPSDAGLKVYTFPQATNPAPTRPPAVSIPSVPMPRAPEPAHNSSFAELKPMKVPKIDQELVLVPTSKETSPKPAADETVAKQPEKTHEGAPAEATSSSATGSSLLAQAIRLHDQGKVTEAIGAANQAIVLWNSDIDSGHGVESARRGIANAKKFISIWQSSSQ